MKMKVLGFALGLITSFALTTTPLFAQASNKIQVNNWNLCVDFQQNNVPLTIQFDGGAVVPAAGVIWIGANAPFEAQIPVSQFPAAAKTVGVHTAIVTAPGSSVIMADGSTLVVPGGSVSVTYDIISSQGPAPSNPRWKKIAGTAALALVGLLAVVLG